MHTELAYNRHGNCAKNRYLHPEFILDNRKIAWMCVVYNKQIGTPLNFNVSAIRDGGEGDFRTIKFYF